MPTPSTVSRCTLVTEKGRHVFEIFGYSGLSGMAAGNFIRSGVFSVGGYDWAIVLYPGGFNQYYNDYIRVRLELLSKDTKTRASCTLRLLSQTAAYILHQTILADLDSGNAHTKFAPEHHNVCSIQRTKLDEASPYLKDDRLTIECEVTVKRLRVSATKFLYRIDVPPSNISEQLAAQILDAEEEDDQDVTISVGEETFTARKKVLALRSPVFRAELYGPMSEARAKHLTIEDMQPAVFRALLHFIDTDSLPDDVDQHHRGDSSSADCEMIWHLLEAADRYALDRLKVCESILCKNLDAETVSTTLALASQHNCENLRGICLQYVSSPYVMDAVEVTQGYKNLKTSCPSVVIEIFEESMRLQNTQGSGLSTELSLYIYSLDRNLSLFCKIS